ncbi:glutamine amidotransferase [Acuticoccus sp. MNP-M23]|uniref:glutamine amidotransferase n=1 Tax=Acuticoccus sp. MNP-M23 TaxID=3072793 RepID=UPI0028168B00|nr:glutamine amidotransferase [Acuticoccus sp. MNP-M23]WMS43920.1 glutamine amidotransferase [Acuticoccus sp. MNP-M23]
MAQKSVLLVGESWVSSSTHYKGFDQFGSVSFHLGAEPLVAALKGTAFDLTYMPAHEAANDLPFDREGLAKFDAIIISDIGANTILLPPAVFLESRTMPNRLKLIRDWTADGGGLMMIGGYLSFQGIDGRARWRRTPVEEALPVTCLPWDDRIEIPEGVTPDLLAEHPVLEGLSGAWPPLLGINEVEPKDGATVLARLPQSEGGHPLLVLGEHGKGRSAAWTSDIGPHWLSKEFCDWEGYKTLWVNLLTWLTEER